MRQTATGSIMFALWVVLVFPFVSSALAAPKRMATVKPGDCPSCHGAEKTLPSAHQDAKSMAYEDCLKCHEKTGPRSLEGKLPGSHIHQLNGVTCIKCHMTTEKPTVVKMEQCVACHPLEKLVEQTAKITPENPHTSPHYGTDLDCNVCHHQHRKSENFCAQCHAFEFRVP
jgi:hypothetical protein